jgi:hypothetical protein
MTVNECRASVEHYRLYGQGYHLQNLDWSQEILYPKSASFVLCTSFRYYLQGPCLVYVSFLFLFSPLAVH